MEEVKEKKSMYPGHRPGTTLQHRLRMIYKQPGGSLQMQQTGWRPDPSRSSPIRDKLLSNMTLGKRTGVVVRSRGYFKKHIENYRV